mmetsp:Transcript_73048/g.144847  ORF Transcript_73048/g.144847 Transcript_73048/m.144847 type:complete len:548 (+) Transcript_73048:40-1683(+)
MASLDDLGVSIVRATPVEDQSTYRYHIQVQLGTATWEVAKRFSDFDRLLQNLSASRYAGLPKLPSKTLLGSPTDQESIDTRKEQLRIILHDLLRRPDTRRSKSLRQFLELNKRRGDASETEEAAPRPLLPEPVRSFEDPRFGVSGLAVAPSVNLILVTHEDSTHLSRLGRVWSVVEPDELGALHLWARDAEGAWKRKHSNTYGIKVRSLCWEDTTRQFFVGLEDGKIEVHAISGGQSPQTSRKAVLELHHKSPVTHLAASPRRLLSLGFDTAMRVIDVRSRELLCGGRLIRRLKNESDYLTCGHLDDEAGRAFVGTSGGDVFVLDLSRNPPDFLHTLELNAGSIAAMRVAGSHFLIAHADCITVMSFEGKGSERRMIKLGCHRAKHLADGDVSILSMAVAPERQLVFGGYSDGSVAIWSNRDGEACIVLRAHQCDVTQIIWLGQEPWGPALYTGGGDGKVTTWRLNANEEDFTFWSPQTFGAEVSNIQAAAATIAPITSSNDTLADFEPAFGNNPDAFRVANPRVNPQALRNAEESDSDDDLADALR